MQIIDTPHNFKLYLSFTGFAFYIVIAVRCGFGKYLYLTICLNAHNHNTCIGLPQIGYIAKNGTINSLLDVFSQDRQTQILAGDAMATTIIIATTPTSSPNIELYFSPPTPS